MVEFLRRTIRRTTILMIVGVFTLTFSGKITDVIKGESTCVCSYDGYGYYIYLTQLFQHRNLDFKQSELQAVQNRYCNGTYAYQLKEMDNGNSLDIYHMGQAYLELPAYAVGHFFAKIMGYPKDGFSKPYHVTFLLNALLFIVLGIYFLNKILRLFFSDQVSALVLLIVYFGTNFWITAIHSYQLQHIYLFTLIGLLFYCLLKFRELKSKKYFLVAALTLGLISSVRPTHVLLGLLPLLMLRKVYPTKWAYWKSISLFPLAGLLFNLPQMLYWKILGGSWFILNMHVEEVVIVDPHIVDFLVSYKKGWLVYSPVFLLLIPGFIQLYKRRKDLFWPVFGVVLLAIWIFASWECWWYAASFGSRAMVDLYPLLAVPLGFAIVYLGRTKMVAYSMMVFVFFTLSLSVFQSEQFSIGYLHPDRMTKAHYWYIFGKYSIPDYTMNRLEIDREDTDWPSKIQAETFHFGRIDTIDFSFKGLVRVPAQIPTLVDKRSLFPKLKTDETLLEAQIRYVNGDSLNPGVIHFETFSKYNTYSWKAYSLVTQKHAGETDTLVVRFNLPRVNHQDDKIQIYVENPGQKEVVIQSLKIKAFSLIRK
ncbi:hypothetical protein [Fluviicola chungangensis]|uniref:Glycosyltransferase RgtA/B/C/D-like domain-containing protein n=1 Tax=Fluviicola chungangensis TaxID=2597671 RepID=A0A556MGZ1_9FLAO|nr:hypothetical protein [Fluviicola chungangensis]TSJ39095.1 hypothetical protein FO442_18145 [Fluviicola chungangensis]